MLNCYKSIFIEYFNIFSKRTLIIDMIKHDRLNKSPKTNHRQNQKIFIYRFIYFDDKRFLPIVQFTKPFWDIFYI